jgi:hypothetical protein
MATSIRPAAAQARRTSSTPHQRCSWRLAWRSQALSARSKIEMSALPGSPGCGAQPRPFQQRNRARLLDDPRGGEPLAMGLERVEVEGQQPAGAQQARHRREGAGEVVVAQEVVEGVVEAGDPVEDPDRPRQGSHVRAMQGHRGQCGARAREHVGREVAARAVVAPADERQQALAGPAPDVEHAAPAQAVRAGERLEPLEPHVVLVVAREVVVVGRERGVRALGAGDPHRTQEPLSAAEGFSRWTVPLRQSGEIAARASRKDR